MSDFPTASGPLQLLLSAPANLEDDLVEYLRDRPPPQPGFTLLPAEAVGPTLRLGSAMEQVRGRARRCLLLVPVDGGDVPGLLAAIAKEFPNPDIQWWLVPVVASGSFAP
jgi:hypothetical protein